MQYIGRVDVQWAVNKISPEILQTHPPAQRFFPIRPRIGALPVNITDAVVLENEKLTLLMQLPILQV